MIVPLTKEQMVLFLTLFGWTRVDETWWRAPSGELVRRPAAVRKQRDLNTIAVLEPLGWKVRTTSYATVVQPPSISKEWMRPSRALTLFRKGGGLAPLLRETGETPKLQGGKLPSRGEMLSVWCIYCDKYHHHGEGVGHRVSHCLDLTPYKNTGYEITL